MTTCPICREDYVSYLTIDDYDIRSNPEPSDTDNKVAHLSCDHHYHKKCIETWINKGHDSCPMCNNKITNIDIKTYDINITDIKTYEQDIILNIIKPFVWKILVRHISMISFEDLISELISELKESRPHILFKYEPSISDLLTLICKSYECKIYDTYLEYIIR